MDLRSCFKIGYISKTHGLKGEVTVLFNHESPDPGEMESLFIEIKNSLVPHVVENYSGRRDKTFVKFEDVNTPEQATQLRGCSLYLSKSFRTKLDRGGFYNDEVVGFEVEDKKLGVLGKIREVLEMGPNRLLAIDGPSKEVLIPVHGPFIQSMNKSKKKFIVDLPEGFLDI